jgi:hypothetical protein
VSDSSGAISTCATIDWEEIENKSNTHPNDIILIEE